MSKLYGIGVGPGDPELLTIKAVNAIKKLDKIIVPSARDGGESVALCIAKNHIPKNAEIINRHFPMILDMRKRDIHIEKIANEICELVKSGLNVGFLVLGDPMIYATYGYIVEKLSNRICIETIPGISSFSAIASGENRVLVEHDKPLVVFPCTGDYSELRNVITNNSYIVLMKVYKNHKQIRDVIEENCLEDYTLVSSNYGKENEQTKVYKNFDWNNISYFTTILINKMQRVF